MQSESEGDKLPAIDRQIAYLDEIALSRYAAEDTTMALAELREAAIFAEDLRMMTVITDRLFATEYLPATDTTEERSYIYRGIE